MSVESLCSRIIQSDKFKSNYDALLKKSVCSQLPNLLHEDVREIEISWSYLLSCASIFSNSSLGQFLDIAYRICQATICEPGLPGEYKHVAAAIFALLSNSSAIALSLKRGLVEENFLSEIPYGSLLDVKRQQISDSIIDGDKIVFLNEFQKEVYNSVDDNQTISVSAPTSAGKSFILLHVISDYIRDTSAAKIVYIVPTRALIQQVELDIREHLKKLNIRAEVTSVPVLPEQYTRKVCTFVFTQERLQWILNEHPNLQFDLIIVDEAQKIGDRSRGILLQQVLHQITYQNETKVIFASPMSENPDALFRTVKPSETQKGIISEIVTVNQNLIWVSKVGSKTTTWKVELLSDDKKLFLGLLKTERITKKGMRLPILAYRIASGKKGNLLYANGAAEAEKVAHQLKSMFILDNPKYVPSYRILELIKLIKKTIHPNYALVDTLKGGVAFHYGNMPLAIRNEIEDLFKNGEISFLVCTSTLIEGVNLPAKTIFVRGPQKGHNQPMNEIDFWNLAGRAGRQGKEFQGNIVCLDAGDESVWINGTPRSRKKYIIKSTVDEIIETRRPELLEHIKSKKSITPTPQTEYDYAYTYFLDTFYRYGSVSNSFMKGLYGDRFCHEIDNAFSEALTGIEVPATILSKNQGVNPIAQQKLLEYFTGFTRDVTELIPPFPEEDDAQAKYLHIIGRISSHLTGESSKLNAYRSVLITNWLRGYGLARIISENINWHKKAKTGKSVSAIIRETMRDIEEYARFRFLKYTTCYIDILKHYLGSKGDYESIEKIPQLSLWLEFGASKVTQITLMSMGFTRTAALELSDLMVDENFDKDKCIWWFTNNDIHSMDLPAPIVSETERILQLQ